PAVKGFSHGDSRMNLKQIALGLQNHHSQMGTFPKGGTFLNDGSMGHSWATYSLPYIGYATKGIRLDLPWNHAENAPYFKCVLSEFRNPDFRTVELFDADGFGLSHYAANSRVLGANR